MKFKWEIIKNKYFQKHPTSNYTTETGNISFSHNLTNKSQWLSDFAIRHKVYTVRCFTHFINSCYWNYQPTILLFPCTHYYNDLKNATSGWKYIIQLFLPQHLLVLHFIKIYISRYTSHRKHLQWSTATGYIKSWFTESQFHGICMTGNWEVP